MQRGGFTNKTVWTCLYAYYLYNNFFVCLFVFWSCFLEFRKAKAAIDIQCSIKFSNIFFYYMPLFNVESFFITPTDSTNVFDFIYTLNQDNSDGPTWILKP